MIAARRHEGRAAAPPRQVETDRAAIELLGLVDVADPQMDVADAQALGRGLDRLAVAGSTSRRIASTSSCLVGITIRPSSRCQRSARPVVVDLDAVALGIVEVERLADAVVGRAGDRHAVLAMCRIQRAWSARVGIRNAVW